MCRNKRNIDVKLGIPKHIKENSKLNKQKLERKSAIETKNAAKKLGQIH
jgi:hypothetical protein